MRRCAGLGVLFAVCAVLAHVPAAASGSVGPGGVKAAARADYSRGKAVVFKELVCRKCAISKRRFNRNRAVALLEEVDAVLAGGDPVGTDVAPLCGVGAAETCSAKLQTVKLYLTRRYRL